MTGAQNAELKRLAKEPGDNHIGHYSRHFEVAAGVDLHDDRMACIQVPCFSKAEGGRVVREIPSLPPQATLSDEIEHIETWQADLDSYTARMPPAYHQHPVVQRLKRRTCIPLALFLDGVR